MGLIKSTTFCLVFSGYIEVYSPKTKISVAYPEINYGGGCSNFQETIQQQGPIGCMPPQNFETNKHQIVRFRGIFAVKRRYEILAEMSDLTYWQINLAYTSPTI